jgi:hypothetical protein
MPFGSTNHNWQDAQNQLKVAQQNIVQVQQKLISSNNDAQEQLWLQQALGAVNRAQQVISEATK